MPYLYLISAILCMASSSVFGGYYNKQNENKRGSSSLYNLIQISCAFLAWLVIFLLDASFNAKVLLYALGFGLFYTVCMVGMINALKTGPIVLTSLFLQLSLIGVTIWGFFFWDASVTPLVVAGLLLVALSLWLCLYKGKKEDGEEKINVKWLIFVAMMFVGNAGCSIVQRTQQSAFNGEHGGLLMVGAMLISTLTSFILFMKDDRSTAKVTAKTSWYFPALAGVCNVGLNVFVMLLATSSLSPSFIYPVLSVGGLAVSMIFSIVAFHERLKWWQWLGFAIGVIAVVILSL